MTRYLTSLLLAALLSPATALAEHPQPPPDDAADEASPEQREKLFKRIRLVRMYALIEALDLDEATAAKLFPYLKAKDEEIKELHIAKRKHSKALRKMLRSEEFPAAAVDEHIAALGRIEVDMAEARADQAKGLKRILSPGQRVKYVMVREKMEQEIRKTIREHRRERMGGEGRRRHRGGR
jgi:Spy/CpxP family protein refolding chaperone